MQDDSLCTCGSLVIDIQISGTERVNEVTKKTCLVQISFSDHVLNLRSGEGKKTFSFSLLRV